MDVRDPAQESARLQGLSGSRLDFIPCEERPGVILASLKKPVGPKLSSPPFCAHLHRVKRNGVDHQLDLPLHHFSRSKVHHDALGAVAETLNFNQV